MRTALVLTSLCSTLLGCLAPTPGESSRVVTQELTLVDEKGGTWGRLARVRDGQALLISSPGTSEGVMIGQSPSLGSYVGIVDESGDPRLVITSALKGAPAVLLQDATADVPRLMITTVKEEPLISMQDPKGQVRLAITPDSLSFLDANGRPRLILRLAQDGTPSVVTADVNGKTTRLVPE